MQLVKGLYNTVSKAAVDICFGDGLQCADRQSIASWCLIVS